MERPKLQALLDLIRVLYLPKATEHTLRCLLVRALMEQYEEGLLQGAACATSTLDAPLSRPV